MEGGAWEELDRISHASTTISSVCTMPPPEVHDRQQLAELDNPMELHRWWPAAARLSISAMYADEPTRKAAVESLRTLFTYEQPRTVVPLRMQDEPSARLQATLSRRLREHETRTEQMRKMWSDALERCEQRCRDTIENYTHEITEMRAKAKNMQPSGPLYRGQLIEPVKSQRIRVAIEETLSRCIENARRETSQQLQLIRAATRSAVEQAQFTLPTHLPLSADTTRNVPADSVLALQTLYHTHLFNINLKQIEMLRRDCDRTWKRGLLTSMPAANTLAKKEFPTTASTLPADARTDRT